MKTLSLFVLLLLSACGTEVHPELEPYRVAFEEAARERGSDASTEGVSLVLGDLEKKAGYCNLFPKATVTIDLKFWEQTKNDPMKREAMVMHELGHCVLGKPHGTGIMASGASIYSYKSKRKQMLDELFTEAK